MKQFVNISVVQYYMSYNIIYQYIFVKIYYFWEAADFAQDFLNKMLPFTLHWKKLCDKMVR